MQDINLYQPVSKGVRGALSASSTATTLSIVACTLLGIWGFAEWQVMRLRGELEVMRNQQQAQAALNAAQGPQLDSLTQEELDALVLRLTTAIEVKGQALNLLRNEATQTARGFSPRLAAFARRHIDGIWLERLTLGASANSVSIVGSTMSPDNVPRYLRSLAADPALAGGEIDDFVIENPRKTAEDDEQRKKISLAPGRLSFRAGKRDLAPAQPEEPS